MSDLDFQMTFDNCPTWNRMGMTSKDGGRMKADICIRDGDWHVGTVMLEIFEESEKTGKFVSRGFEEVELNIRIYQNYLRFWRREEIVNQVREWLCNFTSDSESEPDATTVLDMILGPVAHDDSERQPCLSPPDNRRIGTPPHGRFHM